MGRRFRHKVAPLFTPTDAIHDDVQEGLSVNAASNHVVVQLGVDTGTATVELYARVGPGYSWVLYETVIVDTAGFIRPYFGVPYLSAKVTSVGGGATVTAGVYYDE